LQKRPIISSILIEIARDSLPFFYRALLQKRPIISSILLEIARNSLRIFDRALLQKRPMIFLDPTRDSWRRSPHVWLPFSIAPIYRAILQRKQHCKEPLLGNTARKPYWAILHGHPILQGTLIGQYCMNTQYIEQYCSRQSPHLWGGYD